MAYQFLEIERRGSVEHLTLNRPDLRNAFNERVIAELTQWADEAALQAPGLRVVVLGGRGKAFSAGADLEWMSRSTTLSREELQREAAALQAMLRALDRLPQALIARVHGAAIAGGTGLVAVCDIAVASDAAHFGFSETRLGIVPAVISPYVVAKIGVSAARALFVSGARFSAARALALGLVHFVVAPERLDETVDGCVRDVLLGSPEAVTAAKALVRAVAGRSPDAAAELTLEMIVERRTSAEGRSGVAAFLEKRTPPWVE
jgi:methylglutaconyl-CoA hydratase